MFKKIWEWSKRNVYSLWKNSVLKVSKFNFKKFKFYLKKYWLDSALYYSTWILENLEESRASKINKNIARVKFSIFGIINIQKKYEILDKKYSIREWFYNKLRELFIKEIPKIELIFERRETELSENLKNIRRQYSDLFHMIDVKSNYWIDENWDIILLDGWNSLYNEILKNNSKKVFNILFKKS